MNPSKKQMEFWGALVIICTLVAVLVLLLDFGIKTAILEESTRLRLKIEEWERANGLHTETTTNGVVDDAPINSPFPTPVLVDDPPGMEAGEHPNGDSSTRQSAANRRRAKPRGQTNPRGIPTGNE